MAKLLRPDPGTEIVHVYPVKDKREHITDACGMCWCQPEYERHDDGIVVTHNSAAVRELFQCDSSRPADTSSGLC